nr:odorant binding protein 4 [Graphosoma rubrolineatum]
METQGNLIYTICVAIFILKTRVLAAPTETEDCNIPINIQNTDCCIIRNNESIKEPVIDQECVKILIDSKVSSYEESENALECFFECLLKKTDMLNEENKVAYDQILANVSKNLQPDLDISPDIKIRQCMEKDYVIKESSECKSGSLQLFLCAHRETILHCPADDWINSEECNKYKSALENCPKRTPIFQLLELESMEKTE